MTIQDSIIARFAKARAGKNSLVPLNIQSYDVAGPYARCVVEVKPAYLPRMTNDEIASAVAEKIPGAQYLANSFCVADRKHNLYTMFLSSTAKTMDSETAAAHALKEVAHNVFSDDDDNIWNKVEDANGIYFVAQGIEDFDELLRGVRSRSIATASLEVAHAEGFAAGDMIAAYDPKREAYRIGLAADAETAYFHSEDRIERVSPKMVVCTHERAANVEVSNVPVRDLLAYFRKLYGHNPAYFKKLEQLIKTAVSA